MKRPKKSKSVSWAPGYKLCQVRMFSSNDDEKYEDRHRGNKSMVTSNTDEDDDFPPGFEGKHFRNPSKLELSRIPLIKWKAPPLIGISNDWRVASGEASKEKDVEERRKWRVLEAMYPRSSSIPRSPYVSKEVEKECYDDSITPIIPAEDLDPEEDLEPDHEATFTNEQPQNMQLSTPPATYANSLGTYNSVVLDLLVTTSALMAAIIENNKELLIKSKNPNMMSKVISESEIAAATTTHASSSNVSAPNFADSALEKPATPLALAPQSNKGVQELNQSATTETTSWVTVPTPLPLPPPTSTPQVDIQVNPKNTVVPQVDIQVTSKNTVVPQVEMQVNQENTSAPRLDMPVHQKNTSAPHVDVPINQMNTSAPLVDMPINKNNTSPPRMDMPIDKKNTSAPLVGMSINKNNTSAPLVDMSINKNNTSAPRVDMPIDKKNTSAPYVDMPINKNNTSAPHVDLPINKRKTSGPHVNMQVNKKNTNSAPHGNMHGNQRNTSTPRAHIEVNRTSIPLVPTGGLHSLKSCCPPQQSTLSTSRLYRLPTPSVAPPLMHRPIITDESVLPHVPNRVVLPLRPPSPQQSMYSTILNMRAVPHPPPGARTTSTGVVKDVNYYKSLIRNHGSQTHNGKPCKYFKSSQGCRNGANCPYQHDESVQREGSKVRVEPVPNAKRQKVGPEVAWRM